MTKTKDKVEPTQKPTETNGHDYLGSLTRLTGDVPAELRGTLEPILKDIHKILDPLLTRMEGTLHQADLLAVVADRNKVIDDIRDILNADTTVVKEEKCLICGRSAGEAHGRGTCAAQARLAETRERINQA